MGLSGRPRLTTTSYAVLGLLSLRSWSTYELTEQMARGLARFWPRARSKLYDEPRKLVAAGHATSRTEHVGRRAREVYTITDAGRAALAEWLGDPTPPSAPALESEHLVRVFLAERGTRSDLLRTVDDLRERAEALLATDAAIAQEYLDGTAEFTDRAAITTLVGTLLNEHAALMADWAARTRAVVETWPDDLTRDLPVDRDALEAVVRRAP